MPAKRALVEKRLRQLGHQIAALRREAGLSQEMLAEHAGIHTNHLSMIERGLANPSVGVLFHLSAALQVDIERLFDVTAS